MIVVIRTRLAAVQPVDLDGRQTARVRRDRQFGPAVVVEVAGRDECAAAEAAEDRRRREDVRARGAVHDADAGGRPAPVAKA